MLPHDSAITHVTGESVYVNDINMESRMLHGHLVCSQHARARILSVETEEAAHLEGVLAVITHAGIPGKNQMGPVFQDEPCLAAEETGFIGQPVVLIAATSKEIAREAEKLIHILYEPLEAVTDLATSIRKGNRLHPPRHIECGNIEKGFAISDHIIEGTLETGGQEHWYLETQSCIAVPGEGREIKIFSSTQHPSETQSTVAAVLGIHKNEVEVEVKRMGGAFGGKETQANHYAAYAALLATQTGRPVKIHLTRDEDQIITGKRHPAFSLYKAGFDRQGKLLALEVLLHLDAGSSSDLTMAILERALFHADNAYFIPNMRVTGHTWKTNKPSNTAFRGFGGPQGMAVIENIIDAVARFLGKDALEVRKINFYGTKTRNITHYGQIIQNNRLPLLIKKLTVSSGYHQRRADIHRFNSLHRYHKKGMALTPVKFGISFTTTFLNQAGALINIYTDGTVIVSHGGTEMGQGLHTKILGIAASELGINEKHIRVDATNTSKVPNTSATAASSGSDMNGMAVKDAAEKLKTRLIQIAAPLLACEKIENIVFQNDMVFDVQKPGLKIRFAELVKKAYLERISLSATGFYKTPGIFFDKDSGKGNPFHYFAFGMAVSEVLLDTLTGSVKVLRTDILHDAGKSLNERIDRGQTEGGFIQGLGWVTTENLKYDEKGNLLNHSPDTYKIPTINDIPADFRVEFLKDVPNPNTVRQSKAVGEPPFMLALSVWLAIKDAISATFNHQYEPRLPVPATCENILLCLEELKDKKGSNLIPKG